MNLFIVLLIISLILIPYDSSAFKQKICTQEEAIQAESEATTLKDWDSVYKSFKRFAHCDDGAISEGYSDTIGRLMADDWRHFKRLYKLCSSDKGFERFVLKHIDMTVPVDVLQRIIDNTRLHCPSGTKRLCKAIEAAASAGWKPNLK